MNSLVWFGGLWQRGDQCRARQILGFADLTLVAALNVFLDILIHPGPVIALKYAFLRLQESVMSSEQVSVCILQYFGHQVGWQEDHNPARLEWSLDSSPDDVVFNEAIVGEMSDDLQAFLIIGQLPM